MNNHDTKNIVLPRSTIRKKEGIVILPLNKWKKIEEELEDLEMYRSEKFVKEIEKRRRQKETISLKKLVKKYHI